MSPCGILSSAAARLPALAPPPKQRARLAPQSYTRGGAWRSGGCISSAAAIMMVQTGRMTTLTPLMGTQVGEVGHHGGWVGQALNP